MDPELFILELPNRVGVSGVRAIKRVVNGMFSRVARFSESGLLHKRNVVRFNAISKSAG